MKKYERINQYLEQLRTEDEKIVFNMHWPDLVNVPQLRDIGERTLKNILKEYKIINGLMPEPTRIIKSEKVWKYVSDLYDKLPEEAFYQIRAVDLLRAKELSGVGRTSILTGFAKFILKHPPKTISHLPDKADEKIVQEICSNVSVNLKKIKRSPNLKHHEIAEKIGISKSIMSLIATGKRVPNLVFLYHMHQKFNVNVSSFLFNDGPLFRDAESSQKHEHQILMDSIDSLNQQVRHLKRNIGALTGGKEKN